MKIYTKNGDGGYSSMPGVNEKIIPKNDPRMIFLGEMDELNAHVGHLKCLVACDDKVSSSLRRIQNVLFDISAAVAHPSKVDAENMLDFVDGETGWLETEIDTMTSMLSPLTFFILPGNADLASSYAHIVRTVCRRAERAMVSLHEPPHQLTRYINRLSDYMFTLARFLSDHQEEDKYQHWKRRFTQSGI